MSLDYQIILPTLNEEKNIPVLFYLIHRMASRIKKNFEILLVDDNSEDNTRAVVEELKEFYEQKLTDQRLRVKLCYRPRKMGLGSAYVHAFQFVTTDHLVIMDADLSHHVRHIIFFNETA
jgi:dolichol-phosphate mannosyltransferase